VTSILFETSSCYGHGAEEGSGEEGGYLGGGEIVSTPGLGFYERLNMVLHEEEFDLRVEAICPKFYKSSSGRPPIKLGTYFRMLLLG
jgi:hypothetical protein